MSKKVLSKFIVAIITEIILYLGCFFGIMLIVSELTNGGWESVVAPFIVVVLIATIRGSLLE